MSASTHAQLAAFADDRRRIRQVEGQVHAEREQCAREVQAATGALQAHYAAVAAGDRKADQSKADALQRKVREAQTRLDDGGWQDRIKGAELAERQLQARVEQFVVDNAEALAAEATEAAMKCHADVLAAVDGLTDAYRAYAQAATMWNPILAQIPGKQRVPNYDDLQRLVAQLDGVRVPPLVPPVANPAAEEVAA